MKNAKLDMQQEHTNGDNKSDVVYNDTPLKKSGGHNPLEKPHNKSGENEDHPTQENS